jgi:hypothetical protein
MKNMNLFCRRNNKTRRIIISIVVLGLIFSSLVVWNSMVASALTPEEKLATEKATSSPPNPIWNTIILQSLSVDPFAMGLSIDSNENLYITSLTTISSYIWKYDENGNHIWNDSFSGLAYKNAIDENNNYIYIVGRDIGVGLLLLKYDLDGNQVWNITWDSISTPTPIGIGITILGNNRIFVVGTESTINEVFLAEFNSTGHNQWYRTDNYGDSSSVNSGFGIKVWNDSLFISGKRYVTNNFDWLVAKYNLSGSRKWFTTWGSILDDTTYDLDIDEDGNVYATGNYLLGTSFATAKFNQSGHKIWNRSHDIVSSGSDRGYAITYQDQKIIAAGTSGAIDGSYKTLLCYNKSGNLLWNYNLTLGGISPVNHFKNIVFSDDRNLYTVGLNRSAVTPLSVFLSKFQFLYTPILIDGKVNPSSGGSTTNFVFSVNYTELTNQPPDFVSVVINGTTYNMTKDNPADSIYVDGVIYTYNTTLPIGLNIFYFKTSDGVNTTKSNTLTVFVSDPPILSEATVIPSNGDINTLFTFEVTYTELTNEAPTSIKLWIDSNSYTPNKVIPIDNNYTNGVLYRYTIRLNISGKYLWSFEASDGIYITQTSIKELTVQEPLNLLWLLLIIFVPVGAGVAATLVYVRRRINKRVKRTRTRFDF